MIKFFRHIRQKLLSENKVSKYLIYAIGEIILVVIGILIALQINNWNEEKKQRIQEIETLKNVKTDFINIIEECEENNELRNRVLKSTQELYGVIHGRKQNYSKKQLDSLIATLFLNPTYNGQSETLNILFNSGKINIISNNEIKNYLVAWPQLIEDIKEDEIYSSNALRQGLYPMLRRYISIYEVNKHIDYRNIQLFDNPNESTLSSNYEGLFKDFEFEGVLAQRELTLSVSFHQTQDVIGFCRQLIKSINKEIEQLKTNIDK